MHVKLQAATSEDVESIAALRNAISDDLTFKHGRGPWTAYSTTAAVLSDLREARLLVALHRGEIIASVKFSVTKPTADPSYFSKARRPGYLTAMAVSPERQRQGIGRQCLAQVAVFARREKADAIFLQAFDHPTAGTGPFFSKCGYHETGHVVYRGIALACYETLLDKTGASARERTKKA